MTSVVSHDARQASDQHVPFKHQVITHHTSAPFSLCCSNTTASTPSDNIADLQVHTWANSSLIAIPARENTGMPQYLACNDRHVVEWSISAMKLFGQLQRICFIITPEIISFLENISLPSSSHVREGASERLE